MSPETIARVRRASLHVDGLLTALLRPFEISDEHALLRDAADDLLQAASRYRRTPDQGRRDRAKRLLMEKAILDPRYASAMNTPYAKGVLTETDLWHCVAAASHYGRGRVLDAMTLLEAAIALAPTPFGYLCQSRCASHGLGDDRRALEILDAGLRRFPDDFQLTLSAAAAHFRLCETASANERLAAIQTELVEIVRGSDSGIGRLEAELATALAQHLSVRPKGESTDCYGEESVSTYWNRLWFHMNTLNGFQHGWARLNELYQKQLAAVLTEAAPEVRTVINFGVFCANPDYLLAQRFTDRQFVGVDRERRTKELNETAFRRPNLRFHAAEVIEVLPDLARRDGAHLLFHGRTGTLCYPEFLRILYRACADNGIDYIALWENACLSRTTLRFHDFGDMPAESVAYCGAMFIHDYRRLLAHAGYQVIRCHLMTSNASLIDDPAFIGDSHLFLLAKRSV